MIYLQILILILAIGNELHIINDNHNNDSLSTITSTSSSLIENINEIQHTKWHNYNFKEKIHGLEYENNRKILLTYGEKEFVLISHYDVSR